MFDSIVIGIVWGGVNQERKQAGAVTELLKVCGISDEEARPRK